MHIELIMLKAVDKPLTSSQISGFRIDENGLWDLQACNPTHFDYFQEENSDTSLLADPNWLCTAYNDNIFELVEEDKNGGLNHIYKIKNGAITDLGKTKLEAIKNKLAEITPENFKNEYYSLLLSILDTNDTHIIENGTFYPLDQWLLDEAEKDKQYQVIQVFDAHI